MWVCRDGVTVWRWGMVCGREEECVSLEAR